MYLLSVISSQLLPVSYSEENCLLLIVTRRVQIEPVLTARLIEIYSPFLGFWASKFSGTDFEASTITVFFSRLR